MDSSKLKREIYTNQLIPLTQDIWQISRRERPTQCKILADLIFFFFCIFSLVFQNYKNYARILCLGRSKQCFKK